MKRKNKKILEETLLSEKKIDKIIKNYLLEREDLDIETYEKSVDSFGEDTKEAFSGMVEGLSEILVDLDFIKEKEGDVLLFQDSKDSVYADVHLKELIDKLSDVIEDIIVLTESDTEEDMDS
jgi:hypothetical protein